jgi:5S rRNA maturation endonuclease (ribonuclease M5)
MGNEVNESAKRLVSAMNKHGINNKELARKAGVPIGKIGCYMCGLEAMTIEDAEKIGKILETDPVYLTGHRLDKTPDQTKEENIEGDKKQKPKAILKKRDNFEETERLCKNKISQNNKPQISQTSTSKLKKKASDESECIKLADLDYEGQKFIKKYLSARVTKQVMTETILRMSVDGSEDEKCAINFFCDITGSEEIMNYMVSIFAKYGEILGNRLLSPVNQILADL